MNKQEIFDKVATHLLTQMRQSVDANHNCFYRGPSGTKCAIGCLIPDEEYSSTFEGYNIGDIFRIAGNNIADRPVLASLKEHASLCYRLQKIHDIHKPATWSYYLCDLASDLNLNLSVMNNFKD